MTKAPSVLFLGMMLLAAACSGEGARQGPVLEVEGGWVRAMPLLAEVAGGDSHSAAYFTIRNRGDREDRLLGGESPASRELEVHETRMIDDVMRMREREWLSIPSQGSLELVPGGLHVMLVGLTQTLQEGDSVELTLRFETTGDLVVTLPVRLMGEG